MRNLADTSSKTVLHEPMAQPAHAFFLPSGLASVHAVTTVGLNTEVAVVGRGGIIGSLHLIGPANVPTHAGCNLPGRRCAFPWDHVQKSFERDQDVHVRILEYVQAHAHSLSRVAGCHRIHGASQRLIRWLLSAPDLTKSSTIEITQEVLSEILGTKRVTIVAVAGKLQREKLLEYRRGRIHILDRRGLDKSAYDCCSTVSRSIGVYTRAKLPNSSAQVPSHHDR
jgi:CRP-like cAMP-binding protein